MTIYKLSKELIKEYTKEEYYVDDCKNLKAKEIVNVLSSMKDDEYSESNEKRMDFFRKKIQKIIKAFNETDMKVDKKIISNFPVPSFNVLSYDDEKVFLFIKAFLEEQSPEWGKIENPNRKAKDNYEKKIDLQKDYVFINNILTHLTGDEFNLGNDEKYDKLYNDFRTSILDGALAYIKALEDELKDKSDINKEYDKNSRKKVQYVRLSRRVEELCMEFADSAWDESFKNTPPGYGFRCMIQLFNWGIIQTMQYLWMADRIGVSKENLNKVIDKLSGLERKCKELINEDKKNGDMYKEYYVHNLILMIRDELVQELECMKVMAEEGKCHEIPEKYSFAKKNDELNTDWKKLATVQQMEMFNIGVENCEMKTFRKRYQFCEEFIEKYNLEANRKLDAKDAKTLRAVYKTFYIDKLVYDRKQLKTIAREMIQGKPPTKKLHWILGTTISTQLMLEYTNGQVIFEFKYKLIEILYRISMYMLIKFCPYPGEILKKSSLDIIKETYKEFWEITKEGFPVISSLNNELLL